MAMEMYYTRRSKKAHQLTMEMERSNATDSPVLAPLHHVPPPPPSSHRCTLLLQDTHFSIENDGDKSQMLNHVKPGCLYEIDHAQLPPRTPVQLKSIRVAMVCDITEMNVAVRFPSMESLRAFFNYSLRETHPTLDEKFIMGIALAKRVLIRLVPEAIFTEKKGLLEFWLISSSLGDGKNNVAVTQRKKGSCLSEALKGNGMVRWGIRRQVKYLGRHRESGGPDVNAQNSSSSFVDGVFEESQMEFGASFDEGNQSMEEGKEGDADEKREEKGEEEEEADDDDDDDEDEEEEEEEEEEPREKIKEESNKNLKRKRYSFRNLGARKTKKAKLERISKQEQMQKKNQAKQKKGRLRVKESPTLRDPKDRWSSERYKLAERNLLAVMKSKGATAEKPILRPQLRAEARKRIGDTGLLDHLLKHMAGKLAPGGQERFRRRHNPDGAMEYWLESADLVNIRKDAGVADPFWVPPPGWKLGDSPTQDPICARELKLLKDDISMIKRDLELMAETKMQLEEEVARLRREVIEISSKGRSQDENQASITVASSRSEISQKLNQLANSLESSKCGFGDAHDSLEKYKEQLMVVSDFVKEIEENFGKPTPKVAERAVKSSSETSLMVAEVTQMREKKAEEREAKSKQEQVQALIGATDEGETEVSEIEKEDKKGAEEEEEKAAKRRRLKSGFRICKPEGSFLWPNMMVKDNNINSPSNNMFVQVEVPTPPSVSSSTTTAPHLLMPPNYHHHYHPSLVKPLAEKRAVTVTVSPLSNPGIYEVDGTTPLVNLNEAPPNLDPMPLQGGNARNEVMMANTFCCSSSATSEIVNNWLALSTLKSASDDSSHG